VAKVMISLPDRLLARLHAQAAERGSSRSAMLRELTEAALSEQERLLAERMSRLEGGATGHGGDVASQLEAGRVRRAPAPDPLPLPAGHEPPSAVLEQLRRDER
jgi:predicted DNA-binding protein